MTFDEIKNNWFANKERIISESSLHFIRACRNKNGKLYMYYKCPCGAADHAAMRAFVHDGLSQYLSPVLNCYYTLKLWLVQSPDIIQIIRDEEEKCLNLLSRAPEIVRKVVAKKGWSNSTLQYLKDTHGIDEELSQKIVKGLFHAD